MKPIKNFILEATTPSTTYGELYDLISKLPESYYQYIDWVNQKNLAPSVNMLEVNRIYKSKIDVNLSQPLYKGKGKYKGMCIRQIMAYDNKLYLYLYEPSDSHSEYPNEVIIDITSIKNEPLNIFTEKGWIVGVLKYIERAKRKKYMF